MFNIIYTTRTKKGALIVIIMYLSTYFMCYGLSKMAVQIFWHVQIMLQPFKNLDQCQSFKLMLELHTAKLDSLCTDGTKLKQKRAIFRTTDFASQL